jgi:hypothetical protein
MNGFCKYVCKDICKVIANYMPLEEIVENDDLFTFKLYNYENHEEKIARLITKHEINEVAKCFIKKEIILKRRENILLILDISIKFGKLSIILYLAAVGYIVAYPEYLKNAIIFDRLRIVKYLIETYNFRPLDEYLHLAIVRKREEIIRYFHKKLNVKCNKDNFKDALFHNSTAVIKMLWNDDLLNEKGLLKNAVDSGNLEIIDFICKKLNIKCDKNKLESSLIRAMHNTSLNIIQYFLDMGVKIDWSKLNFLTNNGKKFLRLFLFDYFKDGIYPYREMTIAKCINYDRATFLENFDKWDRSWSFGKTICKHFVKDVVDSSRELAIGIIDWIYKNIDKYRIKKLLTYLAWRGKTDIIFYILRTYRDNINLLDLISCLRQLKKRRNSNIDNKMFLIADMFKNELLNIDEELFDSTEEYEKAKKIINYIVKEDISKK